MKIAVLGLGFMGCTHLKSWQSVAGAQVAGVMSSDETKLAGDLTSISGNLGRQGERFDFSGTRKYRTVTEALADDSIDAIDICLPTGLHSSTAIDSLRAGKHVFIEKPIALDGETADRVCHAAEQSGRILMCGQVLRFIPAYRAAAEWMARAGRVHSAVFRRKCSAPAWGAWLSDKQQSGGGVFDLLIHDADFCISQWGMPESVRASGFEDLAAGVDIMHAELRYPGMGPVLITGGWHHPKAYPFSMDFTMVCQEGAVEWSSASAKELRSYSKDGVESARTLADADAFVTELAYFAECVREKKKPAACPPEQSAAAVKLMHFMLESRERNAEIVRTV